MMTGSVLDTVIQEARQEFTSLLFKHQKLITRLKNKFESIVSNSENVCEEIKNGLKEEIQDIIISAREIERYSPHKWTNCKGCDKPLKPPFYQYYQNKHTGEYYRSGAITSTDELRRYDFLGECKRKDGSFQHFPDADFERLRFVKKDRLCPECYKERAAKVDSILLHLVPDSYNAELKRYMSALPDLSNYPGTFDTVDAVYYDMVDELNIAFAEDNIILDTSAQECLDHLQKNFMEDKGRRYPNEEELTRWLQKRHYNSVSYCKIFDMRDLNHIQLDVTRRFVVIVHMRDELGLWFQYNIPEKVVEQ